jgi:polyhydroxyalkanoate synthesis repressor PhaR
MIRLIKRYESRKLYDTEESRYVSLEEIAAWVREGQEVKVVDNASGADVTSQTLTQIILDEGRRGTAALPSELLHELVRLGERAVHTGMEQVQHGVDRLMQASIDRLGPVRRAREEMSSLRSRLEQLEASLSSLEVAAAQPVPALSALTSTAPNQGTPALAATAPAAPGNGSSTPDREAGR